MMPDLDRLTATAAVQELQSGCYSAQDLTKACWQRIDRHNPAINALVTLNKAGSINTACKADELMARNSALPPLLGVPISIKDAFATQDMITTASFPPLLTHQPAHDATAVARLRAAGAVLMGKSNLPELAGAPHCWSPIFGPTRNPWNPDLTPGGSSGGAAAAIAAGFSLLELGSDIGGSIRIPAAYCGIAALKATENRIPRTGHIPHLPPEFGGPGRSVWHMLSFGALARSVADLHLGYNLIAGPDGIDSTVPPFSPLPPMPPLPSPGNNARPLRIALWEDFAGTVLCRHTQAGLARAAEKLKAAGYEIVRCAPPDFDVATAWNAYGIIGGAEIGLGLPAWQRHLLHSCHYITPRKYKLLRAISRGLAFDPRSYNRALNQREQLIQALEKFLDGWDAVICPVTAIAPYPSQPMSPMACLSRSLRTPAGHTDISRMEATVSMATPFSLTGSPVVTLPASIEEGLPIGIQVLGKRWQEEKLLCTSLRLEAALGGFVAPPEIPTRLAKNNQP